MLRKILLPLILSVCLIGCVMAPPPPQLNPLQIEAMQTQQFDAAKRKTFDAVMTVLQNEGYVIQAANYDTGFITAKSETQEASGMDDPFFQFAMGFGGNGRPEHITFDKTVSAFVTPVKIKGKTSSKVRLSFVAHRTITGGGEGTRTEDKQILDPELYKKIFADIRQQVFVAGAMD